MLLKIMEINAHEVYTPEEVKLLLKISRSTFLRLIKKGILQAQKVGGQYRILGREIIRLVSPKWENQAVSAYKNIKKINKHVRQQLVSIK